MVSVAIAVGEIITVVLIDVAGEDGGVCNKIAICKSGSAGVRKSSIKGHFILELKSGLSKVAVGISSDVRIVDTLGTPDLTWPRIRSEGGLEIGVGVCPGGAVVVAAGIEFDVSDEGLHCSDINAAPKGPGCPTLVYMESGASGIDQR